MLIRVIGKSLEGEPVLPVNIAFGYIPAASDDHSCRLQCASTAEGRAESFDVLMTWDEIAELEQWRRKVLKQRRAKERAALKTRRAHARALEDY